MITGAGFYSQRVGPTPKMRSWKYDGWRRGENSFAEDNEIRDDEFYSGVNIEIVGKASIRLGRRGSRNLTTIPSSTKFNGCGIYKNPKTSENFMVTMNDGKLYKVTSAGAVSEIDNTKTWDGDAKMRGILLREYFYFGNAVDALSRTDGSTISKWEQVTTTVLNTVTLTGTGDDTLFAYGITAVTDVGETETSNIVTAFGPRTLNNSNYFTIVWDRKTDANVVGYNIYKTENDGTLTLLAFLDQQPSGSTMSYVDDGALQRSLIYEAPTFNTTGGVKGNIFGKYANTLFIAGNLQEPDTVFYGGTGSKWESFSPSDNGGWVKPGRGDGEKVTAMIGFDDFLFIFKESSIWKFVFGGDGGPTLTAVIPQYGTASPDTVWRMEKDVVFFGSDGRYRIIGYEPNQLNVIRTTDISNRIQNKVDAMDKGDMDRFFATFFDQKFILCNGSIAYPYDRRYLGFLGQWTNYNYRRFIVWDAGTGQQRLYGFADDGSIDRLLVPNTWDDKGNPIPASLRVKRIDGGEDAILKYFIETKAKYKYPKGKIDFLTYRDGATLVDQTNVSFPVGGGIGEYMFDEAMFDQGEEIDEVPDAIQLILKELELEAYSLYHQINVQADQFNHCIVQTMQGRYEYEDPDYRRDEKII